MQKICKSFKAFSIGETVFKEEKKRISEKCEGIYVQGSVDERDSD
jgi:hypothetical protein